MFATATYSRGAPRGVSRGVSRVPAIINLRLNTEKQCLTFDGHIVNIPENIYREIIEKAGHYINDKPKRGGFSPSLMSRHPVPGIPLDDDPPVAGPVDAPVRRRVLKCFSCKKEGHINTNCTLVCGNTEDCPCGLWHMNKTTRENGSGKSPDDISMNLCKAGKACNYNWCKFDHKVPVP